MEGGGWRVEGGGRKEEGGEGGGWREEEKGCFILKLCGGENKVKHL